MAAKAQQAGSVTIPLTKPMDVDGTKVAALQMREPTVADQLALDAVDGGDVAKELHMIANLCMVTADNLKTLTLRDYKKVQAAFLGFIA